MDILIPIELFQLILTYADFLTQIRLRCVCKLFYNKLEIHDFYHIDYKYLKLLSDSVLQAYPFIMKLHVENNPKITNINHLTKLEVLNASMTEWGINGISNKGIENLNLVTLIADYNENITNINHMTRLQILHADGCCGIGNEGISELNLKILSVTMNEKITIISHMTNLEVLLANSFCGINDDSLHDLRLKELYVCDNEKVTNLNHMTKLEVLYAKDDSGIDDAGICELKSLKKLYSKGNDKITIRINNIK